jgi:DNA mismatch repair protein MutL
MQAETPHPVRPPKISRLPEELINQIAAGEVVERPASAVKELIENSLDAGATRIEVYLKEGGMEEILIVDNGCGMEAADLRLSIERHATSKLKQLSDLDDIGTFGFRGEALSSISSVADVQIRSRTADSPQALVLTITHGKLDPEIRPASGPVGTALRVRELFSRIPARQKFLRSASTEFSHCARVIRELALGNANVSFVLHHQDRLIHSFPAGNRSTRFKQCIKVNWEPLRFEDEGTEARVEALLSPDTLIQDRGEIFFFVNGRSVRNKGLVACIRNAYLNVLGPHHEPSGVVFLDIRRDWVDVNVHPQKLEVRLLKQESLYGWMSSLLKKGLAQQRTVVATPPLPSAPWPATGETAIPRVGEPVIAYPYAPFRPPQSTYRPPETIPLPTFDHAETTVPAASGPRPIGALGSRFWLAEDKHGLLILDPSAFEERLAFESLKRAFAEGTLDVQRLLVPRIVRLTPDLQTVWQRNQGLLDKAGFETELFGEGDLAIKSRPALVPESALETILREALESLATDPGSDGSGAQLSLLMAAAARHPTDSSFSGDRARRLWEKAAEIDESATTPHGRPVLFRLSFRNIERHFERT